MDDTDIDNDQPGPPELWTPQKQRTRTAKPIHYAHKIRLDGAVSALCFEKPRAIDLTRASWSNRASAVTCAKCRQLLDARGGTS